VHAGQRADDFQVAEFLGSDIHQQVLAPWIVAIKALDPVLHRGRELAVCAANAAQQQKGRREPSCAPAPGTNAGVNPSRARRQKRNTCTLLQLCADPNAASARLTELATQMQELRDAIAQHDAAKVATDAAAAGLADLQQREQNLAAREDGLLKATTQLSVANHANASREDGLNAREQALDRRQAEIDARAKALEDKLAAYRQALA
jgi:hypothetical protein